MQVLSRHVLCAVSLGLTIAAQAQTPTLVWDFNTETSVDKLYMGATLGSRAIVSVDTGVGEPNPFWITDGTNAGTRALPSPPFIPAFVGYDGKTSGNDWVFSVFSGPAAGEWRFDLTTEQFTRLNEGQAYGTEEFGGVFFYIMREGPLGISGWRFDPGSPPERLPDSTPLPQRGVLVNGTVYYLSQNNGSDGQSIWSYNLATREARQIVPLVNVGYRLYAIGRYICALDYTGNGTETVGRLDTQTNVYERFLIVRAPNTSIGFDRVAFGRYLVQGSVSTGPYTSRAVLFTFDPDAGTFNTYSLASTLSIQNDVLLNDVLYFPYRDASNGWELFRFRSTSLAPECVTNINPGPADALTSFVSRPFVAAGKVWFSAHDGVTGEELWVYDPSDGTVRRVRDVNPGAAGCDPYILGAAGNIVLFEADDSVHGRELWRTDGAESGTFMVRDFQLGSNGSSPDDLTRTGDQLLFSAATPIDSRRLYITHPGGLPIALTPPQDPDASFGPFTPVRLGDRFIYGGTDQSSGRILGVTDGTPQGTRPLAPSSLLGGFCYQVSFLGAKRAVVGSRLVFSGRSPSSCRLWVTDGTEVGTRMLAPSLTPTLQLADPDEMTFLDGRLFFTASESVHGSELWSTDGTPEGTRILSDLVPGVTSSYPAGLVTIGGRLYCTARLPAGNALLSIDPVSGASRTLLASPTAQLQFGRLHVVGGLIAFTLTADANPTDLWTYNPATDRVARIADSDPVFTYGITDSFTNESLLYFFENTTPATESLFVFDAAHSQVRRLIDGLYGGSSQIFPHFLFGTHGLLCFSINDGIHGHEPWITDGTVAGTRLLADLVPGPESSFVQSATIVGDKLYLSCSTPQYGWELYTLPLCPADFNLDFGVTMDDLFAFLDSFAAGSPSADCDDGSGSGAPDAGVTIDDLLYYLQRFIGGC